MNETRRKPLRTGARPRSIVLAHSLTGQNARLVLPSAADTQSASASECTRDHDDAKTAHQNVGCLSVSKPAPPPNAVQRSKSMLTRVRSDVKAPSHVNSPSNKSPDFSLDDLSPKKMKSPKIISRFFKKKTMTVDENKNDRSPTMDHKTKQKQEVADEELEAEKVKKENRLPAKDMNFEMVLNEMKTKQFNKNEEEISNRVPDPVLKQKVPIVKPLRRAKTMNHRRSWSLDDIYRPEQNHFLRAKFAIAKSKSHNKRLMSDENWMVVDQELIQEDRSHSQELVIPKIIPRSNNLWTPERLAFKKELQDKLAPVGLSNARSTPKLQIFDDNGGELELRNTIDNNRRKAYAISTITPSLLTKKSSLDRRLLEIDISKVRYSTDVSRKKLLEGGKKGKNWQSNFAVVTDTSIIFWKDKHTYNNYVQALNNPTRSPKLGFVSQHTPELILPLQGLDISLADEGLTSKDRAFRLWASAGQSGSETGVHGVLLRTEHREAAEALLAIMCPGLVSDKALTTSSSTEDFTSAKKSQDSIKRSGSSEHLDREQARFNLLQWFKKRPAKDILINKGIIQGTIFGGSLDAICTSEGSHVPLFVHKCTSRLESGPGFMEADGLYRASANLSMIQRLRIQVDQGNLKAVEEEDDPHVIAGTLKLFFRELKEPLIPFNVFDEFLEASGMPDPKERVERFRELVQSLPPYNKDTLEHVVAHLVCVTRFGDTNRMHVGNLAIVWGPSLMWKPPEDAASGDVPRSPSAVCYDIAVHCFQQNLTIEILITNHDQIFL